VGRETWNTTVNPEANAHPVVRHPRRCKGRLPCAVLTLVVSVSALIGCGSGRHDGGSERFRPEPTASSDQVTGPGTSHATTDNDALLPARVRIHPLTRLVIEPTPNAAGTADSRDYRLACHIELRDRFGHVVKGLGQLRVELYRPSSSASGGPESQDTVWNIDLRDPVENARVYDDLVTRTYTVYLTSLPDWLQEWARQGVAARGAADSQATTAGEKSSNTSGWVSLKAFFIVNDSRGRERVLQTSYRLER